MAIPLNTAFLNSGTYFFGMIELSPHIYGNNHHGLGITWYMQRQSWQWHNVSPWHQSKFTKIWGGAVKGSFVYSSLGDRYGIDQVTFRYFRSHSYFMGVGVAQLGSNIVYILGMIFNRQWLNHAQVRRCKDHVDHTMDMLWEKFQWILPLYRKPISFQSKASVVCSVTTAVVIDFCLKKLNVFSQHIGKKTNEYLNSAEQIPRNWHVDHVSVLITSWDIT